MNIELSKETKLFIEEKIGDKEYLKDSLILYWLGRLDKINYYYLQHLDAISASFLSKSAGYTGNKGQGNIMVNEDQNMKLLAHNIIKELTKLY